MTEKSPYFVEAKPLTRLDELRERLDRLESRLGGIEKAGLSGSVMEILEQMDQAHGFLLSLEQEGKLPPEEAARFESIEAQIRGKGAAFLRAAGGSRTFINARLEKNPDPQRWWWFIDRILAEERLRQGKRLGIRAAILVVVLVGLGVLYEAFLAPPPQEEARYEYETMADSLIASGNLEGALEQVENALAVAPGSTELLVRKGVLQQALGRQEEAEQTFAEAQAAIKDAKLFYIERGQGYLQIGDVDAAMADAETVIALDPESAEGYLLLGQAYEFSEQYSQAIQTYEKASTLANEQNRPDLAAIARIRLAYLMQRIPATSP